MERWQIFRGIMEADTILNFAYYSYFFSALFMNLIKFEVFGYYFSFFGVFVLNFLGIVLNRNWFLQKKAYIFQIIYSSLSLMVNAIILSVFSVTLSKKFSIGFIIYLIIVILNFGRILVTVWSFYESKQKEINTKLLIRGKKNFILAGLTAFMLIQAAIVLPSNGLGLYQTSIDISKEHLAEEGLQLSFYASKQGYDYLTNDTILSALNGSLDPDIVPAQIIMHVSEIDLMDGDVSSRIAGIIGNCTNSGLDVYIWFYYIDHEMYPSWENIGYLPIFKSMFDSWVANYNLSISGIIMDLEFDQSIAEMSPLSFISYGINMLNHKIETERNWTETVQAYTNIMDSWRSTGYEIGVVGMDITLRDIADNDPDLQQMFGLINNPPEFEYWDRASFMLYRHCEYHTTPFTQDYVYNQAKFLNKYYPDNGVVALGCTFESSYDTVDEILQDLAIVKSTGVATIELFNFYHFFRIHGLEGTQLIMNASKVGWTYPKFKIHQTVYTYLSIFGSYAGDVLMNFH